MKLILVVLTLCTVSISFASTQEWMNTELISCGNGNEYKGIEKTTGVKIEMKIDAKLTTLTKKTTEADGQTVNEVNYKLTKVGKSSYIASAKGSTPFIVNTYEEFPKQISVVSNDTMGDICGGGIIVKHLLAI